MGMIESTRSTSTDPPTVVRGWKAAASRDPDRVVLISTDPADIIAAIANNVAGIVTNNSAAEFALCGIELGVKTRSKIGPEPLGLTRWEAEIIALRAAGMGWTEIAAHVGYCERQARRIFDRLTARFRCTPQALTALAQVIDITPVRRPVDSK
jgi:DNA-binding NarL/FixJ family response regulator